MFPATGWVRANSTASPELLAEINSLRKRNEELQLQLNQPNTINSLFPENELAELDSELELTGTYKMYARSINHNTQNFSWRATTTWSDLFARISPLLSSNPRESEVNRFISEESSGTDKNNINLSNLELDQQSIFTIRVQFIALNLITIDSNQYPSWSLTSSGTQKMIRSRAIKRIVSSD